MTKEEIYKTITDFLDLIFNGKGSIEENEKELLFLLDKIAVAYHYSEYEFDNTEYPEPPAKDYSQMRNIVSERFLNFGFYNLPESFTTNITETGIMIGDAIDDIT